MAHATGSCLRWLVAGTFSPRPAGRLFSVSGERFSDVLTRCDLELRVEVPDRIGARASRSFDVTFVRPRDFRLRDLIASQPCLEALEDVAEALTHARDPISVLAAADRVRALVGDGTLTAALAQQSEPTQTPRAPPPDPAATTPPSSSGSPPGQEDSAIDAIFSKAEAPPAGSTQAVARTVKSGLDAFVSAVRGGSTSNPPADATPRRVTAAASIREAIQRTALDVLGEPRVARLERAWRGLRMVIAASPGHDDLAVDALDVEGEALPETLRQMLGARSAHERPDAVFVTHGVDEMETLRELARVGAEHRVAIVVGVDPALFAAHDEDEHRPPWTDLRADPAAKWLAVAANPVMVANEPTPVGPRWVTADPSLGVAAVLSACVQRPAAFSDVVGRGGAIRAPAARDVEVRGRGHVTVATRELVTVTAQQEAAARGAILLGHDRDRIMLVAAPTVAVDEAAGSLPARILGGRATREQESA